MDNKQSQRPLLTPTVRPLLAQKARVQTLLYPEGVVMLNETGVAIVKLCDGQHTLTEIIAELAQYYRVTPDVLQDDVGEYIMRLYKHSLIDLRHTEDSQ